MPWVNTTELPDNRRGQVNHLAEREYQRTFLVQMDSSTDGSIQVSVAPGIPRMFMAYVDADGTFDFGARVYDVSAIVNPESMLLWTVTVKYASGRRSRYSKGQGEKGDDRQSANNPLLRAPIVVWSSTKSQRPYQKDDNGADVQNTAGAYFDPPLTREDTFVDLTIIRNEASFDPSTPGYYKDAINSDSFWGYPAYTWKVEQIGARSNMENAQLYWEVTYQFHHRPWLMDPKDQTAGTQTDVGGYVQYTSELGWLDIVRNRGLYYLDPNDLDQNNNPKRKRCFVIDPTTGVKKDSPEPMDLDMSGNQLAAATPPPTPFYLVFSPYQRLPFAPLRLSPI